MSEFYFNDELSLEALIYDTFYRKHGIFRAGDLLSPKLSPITQLELPKNAVAHHYSTDDISIGPEPEGLLYKTYPGRLLVEHVSTLHEPIGSPRPNRTVQSGRLSRDYHRRFRKMRPLHGFDKVIRNELTLPVINYAQLNTLFWYMRSVFSNFYKWHNIYKTVFFNLNAYCARSPERQHFILAGLPKQLPSLENLKLGSKNSAESMSRRLLEVFAQPENFFILEMWKFFGMQRDNALMAQIDKAHFNNINIIWHDSGRWFGMNLGKVLELDPGTDEEGDVGSNRLQRVFLRMLIALASGRTDAVAELPSESVVDDANPESEGEVPEEGDDGIPQVEPIVQQPEEDDLDALITDFDPDEEYPDTEPTPKKTSSSKPTTAARHDEELLDEENLEADLEVLERLASRVEAGHGETREEAPPKTPREALTRKCDRLAEEGQLSAAEYRRYLRLIEKSDAIPNPFGKGTLREFSQIDSTAVEIKPEDTRIPKLKGVIDDSMLESTLQVMDRRYIGEVLQKDIINAATGMEAAGVIVTDYKVEDVTDVANHYQVMTMRVNPIDGEPSTLRFRVPVVDESGVFESNGVKYHLRKQRSDLPIRKVSPSSVALTSYYAKVFVDRSDKSVVNYGKWLTGQIRLLDTGEAKDRKVKDVKYIDVMVKNVKLPRVYTILASKFREFTTTDGTRLYFDYVRRLKLDWAPGAEQYEVDGFVFCGMKGNNPITVDATNTFYITEGKARRVLGSIEDLLGLDAEKAPVEIAEFRLFSRNVPVGIALGYHYGLERLMQILGVVPRRVPNGQRMSLTPDEYAVRFADESLVFSKADQKAQLILAGFNRYHKSIARYQVSSFNAKEVYVNVMEENGIRVGFVRELELAMDMYVDPITRELLEAMGEPTTLDGLLLRACELLLTDWAPDETDMSQMRIRGYERMAGAVYTEMVKAMRRYRSRGVGREAKVELNPEAVWMSIHQDAVGIIEESNPIKNLKEKELVTYSGTGGRSAKSMVKATRSFHETDVGVISESSVDSGSVGINIYMTANPQFKSLRGVTKVVDPSTAGAAALLSTSALLAPGVDCDDGKRAQFVTIQNEHVVAAAGYITPPLRTSYESVIAHRVDDLFAYTAKEDGEIVELTKKHVKIQYASGKTAAVELGVRYGTVTGKTIPHEVVCDLAVGSKVELGDVITYNTGYFQRNILNKKQVLLKTGILAKTAIMEQAFTFEDASVISERVTTLLETGKTHVRTLIVRFDQTLRDMVKVGSDVELETILCTIEDSVTASNDLFDEESLDTLNLMSSNTPTANHVGKVEKIEVLYHGDLEDMSPSIRALTEASDKERIRLAKALGKRVVTGQVDSSVRVGAEPLDVDTVAIKVYITETLSAGVGDKGVFGNQLKTVFSNVMTGINRTESGEDLDAFFAYTSIANRIVLSPEILGTTIVLLKLMSKKVAETYFTVKG